MAILTSFFGKQFDSENVSYARLSDEFYPAGSFVTHDEMRDKCLTSFFKFDNLGYAIRMYGVILKKDAIRLHRHSNDYVHKSFKDNLVHVKAGNCNYYFLNERHRFESGFMFHLNKGQWVDLKVKDKHLRSGLAIAYREDETRFNHAKYCFDWRQRNELGAIMNGDFINFGHLHMPFVTMTARCVIHKNNPLVSFDSYSLMAILKKGCDQDNVAPFRITQTSKYYGAENEVYRLSYNSRSEIVHGSSFKLLSVDRMSNDTIISAGQIDEDLFFSISRIKASEIIEEFGETFAGFDSVSYDGKTYINRACAVANGYTSIHCPHCNSEVSGDHDMQACEERNFRPSYLSYHSYTTQVKDMGLKMKDTFRIGVEIEKESMAGAKVKWEAIHNEFGWRKERDGSLNDRIGYELVSPIYSLFSDACIQDVQAMEDKWNGLINSDATEKTGGHIHFSRIYTKGKDLYKMIEGYIPMLYAIYPKRAKIMYSEARNIRTQMEYPKKYSAIQVLDDRIEIRIFSGVDKVKTLDWRIKLLRIFANNPTDNPIEVVNMMLDTQSDLHKHMLAIYTEEQIKVRAKRTCNAIVDYHNDYSSSDVRAIVESINHGAQN